MIRRLRQFSGLLSEPAFRRLWLAQSISQFGTQVTQLALPLVAILVLQASPFEVALLGGLAFLPYLLFTLPAGVWVDRLPRKRILVTADLGRAIVLALVPIAAVAHVIAMWQLYLVAFVSGSLSVFFDVAYQATLPEIVDRGRLAEGNSRLEISRSAAQVLGPGIGGALVGILTAPIAILVDAASYVGSAAFLFGLRPTVPRPRRSTSDGAAGRSGLRHEMAEGLRFFRRSPILMSASGAILTLNFASNIGGSIFIVFIVRELGMTPAAIGLAFSLASLGTLVGAVIAQGLGRRLGVGPAILVMTILATGTQVLYAFATADTIFAMLVVIGWFQGISFMTFNVLGVSVRQSLTPAHLQGRVNATGRWLNWSAIPLVTLIGGVLGSVIGLRETVLVGALLGLLANIPLAMAPIRTLRDMPATMEVPTPPEVPTPLSSVP